MALRIAHIYLPKEISGFLDDLKEKFSIIEHYEIEEKNWMEVKLLLDAELVEPVRNMKKPLLRILPCGYWKLSKPKGFSHPRYCTEMLMKDGSLKSQQP